MIRKRDFVVFRNKLKISEQLLISLNPLNDWKTLQARKKIKKMIDSF